MSNSSGGPRDRQYHTNVATTKNAFTGRRKHSPYNSNCRTPLTREELAAIFEVAKSNPVALDLQDVAVLVLNTGIRVRELQDLRWENIDFVSRHLLVSSNSKKGRTRRVPFGPTVLRVLQARRARGVHVLGKSPGAVVERVRRELRRLSKGALPITLHRLRLTFITRWIHSGGSPEALAMIIGWSSYHRLLESLLTPQQRYEIAAGFQDKLDQQE